MRTRRELPLGEQLAIEAALDDAFEPLRHASTDLSPLRARAAVRWGRGGAEARRVPWAGAVSRLSELGLAVGMASVIFAGAFGSAVPANVSAATMLQDEAWVREAQLAGMVRAAPSPLPSEEERFLRWFRLDRYIPIYDWLDPTVVHVSQLSGPAQVVPPRPAGLESSAPY